MRECSLVVIFEVCALYTAVLLGQIVDVCAWCVHSAHVGYTHTNTCTHTLTMTGSVVVLSLKWLFCCFHHKKKTKHYSLQSVCQCHTHVSLRVNVDEQQ